MKRLKVAHVITRLCRGGAQENTFHSVRLADSEHYEVDLVSGPTAGAEGSIEERVTESGIEIIRIPALTRDAAPSRDIRALSQLRRQFRHAGYHIVHTHTSKAGFLGRLAAHQCGVPIVVHTPHGNIFDGYFSRSRTLIYTALERRAARWTDRIIELTQSGVEDYLSRGIGKREQFDVIFSGIDLAPYESALADREATRESLGIDDSQFLIGAVGRLEPIKGFTYFIAAAKSIAGSVPQARFVLAGAGSLEAQLKAEAAELGDRFRFLGMYDDVPRLMAAIDVLAVPSVNEGMGRVILEAGAAATPVVASAVGGIPDIVEDGKTGVLVPSKSPEAIAEVLMACAQDRERCTRLGQAARAAVVPGYSLEEMVMRIERLYSELAKEKNLDT